MHSYHLNYREASNSLNVWRGKLIKRVKRNEGVRVRLYDRAQVKHAGGPEFKGREGKGENEDME